MMKALYFLIGIIFILSLWDVNCQSNIPATIPQNYGSTNFGTDFWLTFHPNYQGNQSSNTIRIYVTSAVATLVKLEVPGRNYKAQVTTIPNNTVQFDMSITIGQPYSLGMSQPPPEDQVYGGAGIHITSDDPVAVYGLALGSSTSDAYMALPVSTWGKEYFVASWEDNSDNVNDFRPSITSIISAFDNTRVSIVLGGTPTTMTKGGMRPGEVRQYTLYTGDVLLIPSIGRYSDLSGTKIFSNKPIGVVSGNRYATVPDYQADAGYLVEMELPSYVWGKEYYVAPIYKRKKNPFVKIFAKEDNTKIYKNGIQITTIKYAGGIENDGWIKLRTDNGSPTPVTFSADKPISITMFNTSKSEDTTSFSPFQMVQIPVELFQKEMTFTTPSAKFYLEFMNNFINIIYESDDIGTVPDDLEYGQEVNGSIQWVKINISSPTPGTPIPAVTNGKKYYAKSFPLPTYGTFKLRANNPFMAYAYGYSSNSAYGYPASALFLDQNKPLDNQAPEPTFTVNCDGSVVNAVTEDMPKNSDRSNLSAVCYHNTNSFNYDFSYTAFVPGDKEKTTWNLRVKDATKDARAVITFGDRRGNDTTIVVQYTVRKPFVRVSSVDLGLARAGSTVAQSEIWVYNGSSTSSLNLTNAFLKFNDRGFELLDGNSDAISLPLVILPNDSVKFKIRFTNSETGVFTDSIGISDDCFTWFLAAVKAEAGKPQITVSDYSFPDTYLQTKSSGQIVIRNPGNYTLKITGFTPPTESAFTFDLPEISSTVPLILEPGQMFSVRAEFTPSQEKDYIDSLVFVSDASETDPVSIVSGKGIIFTSVNEKEISSNSVQLYPNPADSRLIVKFNKLSQVYNIKLFDIYGNLVREQSVNEGQSSAVINVSGLTNGVYLILLNSLNGTVKSSFNIVH